MPLEYRKGDLFSARGGTLVIPVNCRGVAGCGVALQCKQRYPGWFREYRASCRDGLLWLSHPVLHDGLVPQIISLPTKDDWRRPAWLFGVEMGLIGLVGLCERCGVDHLAMPRLGCGVGGLDWEEVRPLMEEYLSRLPGEVWVYV
jgi:O-acetyl-ADP-ribose deacetylase (regulator of RNase III)